METKKCTKCGRNLPLSFFSKNRNSPDGLQYWCKDCSNKEARKSVQKNRRKAVAMSKTEKRCPHCGRILPVDAFNRNRSALDGRQVWCRECEASVKAERRRRGYVRDDAKELADTLFPEQEEPSVAKSLKIIIDDDTRGAVRATFQKDGKDALFEDFCEFDKRYLALTLRQVAIVMEKAILETTLNK